jgi:hypothetical protein
LLITPRNNVNPGAGNLQKTHRPDGIFSDMRRALESPTLATKICPSYKRTTLAVEPEK